MLIVESSCLLHLNFLSVCFNGVSDNDLSSVCSVVCVCLIGNEMSESPSANTWKFSVPSFDGEI